MGDSKSKQFGDTFLNKLDTQLDKKAPVFGESLFAGAGTGTKNAWNAGTNFATGLNNAGGFGTGQRAAMDSLGGVFKGYGALGDNGGLTAAQAGAMSGNRGLGAQYAGLGTAFDQDAPGYQTLRNKLRDDTATGIYNDFNNSGLFGSDNNLETAGEGIATALAGLDYGNYQNSINNKYRSLDAQRGIFGDTFNMGQTGIGNQFNALGGQAATAGQQFGMGQTALTNQQGAIDALSQIGAAQDANAQGALLGRADLFDRTKSAELDRLAKIGGIFGDPIEAANEAPWWQQALGWFANNAGNAARVGLGG